MSPSFFVHPLHFSLANSLFKRADLNSSLFCRMLISSSLSDSLSVAVSSFSFLVFNSNSRLATCFAKFSRLFRAMTEGVEEEEELLDPSLDEEDDAELSKLGLRFSKKVLDLLDFTGLECLEGPLPFFAAAAAAKAASNAGADPEAAAA